MLTYCILLVMSRFIACIVLLGVCGCLFLFSALFFFFKQKTAYEMRISDWSSDVCSSDLGVRHMRDGDQPGLRRQQLFVFGEQQLAVVADRRHLQDQPLLVAQELPGYDVGVMLQLGDHDLVARLQELAAVGRGDEVDRSEEHTSELQSLMRISYAVFC